MSERDFLHIASTPLHRAGPEYRSGDQRIFHVKNIGWFLALRGEVEVHAGIEKRQLAGPFKDRLGAKQYLMGIIAHESPEVYARLRGRVKSV